MDGGRRVKLAVRELVNHDGKGNSRQEADGYTGTHRLRLDMLHVNRNRKFRHGYRFIYYC